MKVFLDLEQITRQPHRWAVLLSADAHARKAGRGADFMLVVNYLARQFVGARKAIVQRRRASEGASGRERYILRPVASAEQAGAGRTWLGFVCEYDSGRRALRVVDRAAVQPGAVQSNERIYSGEIMMESRTLAPAYCDNEAMLFLEKLPLAAEEEPAPTDRWRAYIDWRRKLAETKAAEKHTYLAWERLPGRIVRFFLSAEETVDELRQRFQDEELRAGIDVRAPQGVFRRVSLTHGPEGERKIAVDVEFDGATWGALQLTPHGDLRVAMEGEISTLDIQVEGLRRFAEKQAQNPYLAEWLFDVRKAKAAEAAEAGEWTPLLPLNPEQREAVGRALAMDDLLLLWGPPGTGKTTVIAEICAQYALRGQRVLVASQANLAVEQALGRLPANATVRPAWVSTARKRDGTAGDVRGGLRRWLGAVRQEVETRAAKAAAGDPWTGFLNEWTERLGGVASEEFSPEDEERYLRRANVIGATCNEAGKPDFVGSQRFSARFDLVIVDEVSKASPPELLVAMLMGRRIMLAGDHRQLPPLFKDEAFEDAVENGEIGREEVDTFRELVTASWFDRAFREAAAAVKVGLRRQYRMHPRIMEAVNLFYADQPLLAGDGAQALAREKAHGLRKGAGARHSWLQAGNSLVWIDTERWPGGRPATEERRGTSRRNRLEAELAAHLVEELAEGCEAGGLSLGVISFYRAQADLIRDQICGARLPKGWLHPWRDVNTVDQFQGSERDVIIVSLVRTGGRLTGEFTRDFRRINVALSRARKLLIVLGARATFGAAGVKVPTAGGEEAEQRVYERIHAVVAHGGGALDVEAFAAEGAGKGRTKT